MDTISGEALLVGDFGRAAVEDPFGVCVPGLGDAIAESGRPVKVVGNIFRLECFGPDGELKWSEDFGNAVTLSGLDNVLDVYLGAATQTTVWYLGLVDNAGFTAFVSSDTMASHTGWTEATGYSGSTRPSWTPGASSGQSVTNGSTSNFAVTATATIRGLFLTSSNNRGGTDGKLFSTAQFAGGNQPVNSGDTLKATYTVSATTS